MIPELRFFAKIGKFEVPYVILSMQGILMELSHIYKLRIINAFMKVLFC